MTLEIIGLGLNFIGGVILIFSTYSFFKWIIMCFNAHEIVIQTLISGRNVLNISGTTKHLLDTYKIYNRWIIAGLSFSILGFSVQAFALIYQTIK